MSTVFPFPLLFSYLESMVERFPVSHYVCLPADTAGVLLTYPVFTGTIVGASHLWTLRCGNNVPLISRSETLCLRGEKSLHNFIITMWTNFGLHVWGKHLIGQKEVKDTLGPFSTHSVNSAATYSSPSWAQTFSICPLYGFSREDVGRSAASSQVSTNAHSPLAASTFSRH